MDPPFPLASVLELLKILISFLSVTPALGLSISSPPVPRVLELPEGPSFAISPSARSRLFSIQVLGFDCFLCTDDGQMTVPSPGLLSLRSCTQQASLLPGLPGVPNSPCPKHTLPLLPIPAILPAFPILVTGSAPPSFHCQSHYLISAEKFELLTVCRLLV